MDIHRRVIHREEWKGLKQVKTTKVIEYRLEDILAVSKEYAKSKDDVLERYVDAYSGLLDKFPKIKNTERIELALNEVNTHYFSQRWS